MPDRGRRGRYRAQHGETIFRTKRAARRSKASDGAHPALQMSRHQTRRLLRTECETTPLPGHTARENPSSRSALNSKKERNGHAGLNQTCGSSVHRARGSCRAAHPRAPECRALASSTPVFAGQWPMPDVGHSYWGRSSSILRMKHSCKPKSVFVAAYGPTAVGTFDAGFPLHSLPWKGLIPLYYSNKVARQRPDTYRTSRLHHCRGNIGNRQFHIV
jgi:hypothetical protein